MEQAITGARCTILERRAMREEIAAMQENQTWNFVDLPRWCEPASRQMGGSRRSMEPTASSRIQGSMGGDRRYEQRIGC